MNNSDNALTHPALTPSVTPCASPQNGQMQKTKRNKLHLDFSVPPSIYSVVYERNKSWRNIYDLNLKPEFQSLGMSQHSDFRVPDQSQDLCVFIFTFIIKG